MCHDGKILSLKLTNTPMVGGTKWNLVSMDQMTYEHLVVVVQLEEIQRTHGGPRNVRPPHDLNHIRRMLVRYKNVFTNRLLKKKLPLRSRKQLLFTERLSS